MREDVFVKENDKRERRPTDHSVLQIVYGAFLKETTHLKSGDS